MSDLDRYLDDFGRTLERATAAPPEPVRARRRRLVLPVAGLAAAAAAALIAVLALPGAQDRFDPVAEARAALTPEGEILHTVITQTFTSSGPAGRARPTPRFAGFRQERWAATSPSRWRAVNRSGGHEIELSFDGEAQRLYDRRRNRLSIVRGLTDPPPRARQVVPPTDLGDDPIATLETLLTRGDLRDAGTRAVAGREVRVLTGETRIDLARGDLVVRSAYHVDPATSAPISIRQTYTGQGRRTVMQVRFATFERLPLTPETAKLLTIDPKPNAKVVVARSR